MTRKSVHPYHQPAGGWGALKALSEALLEQGIDGVTFEVQRLI